MSTQPQQEENRNKKKHIRQPMIVYLPNLLIGGVIGLLTSQLFEYFFAATGRNFGSIVIVFLIFTALSVFGTLLAVRWFSLDAPEQARISAQIFSVAFAALMGLVALRTNREDARCLRLLEQKDVMTELLRKITFDVQDGIGVPENCFDTKGATVPMQATEEGLLKHQEYAKNVALLAERLDRFSPAIGNQLLMDSYEKYSNARFTLEKQCGERNAQFGEIYHAIRPAEGEFVEQLNLSIADCYAR